MIFFRFTFLFSFSRITNNLAMDGDRDRDPHWYTGLNSLGPNEKQKDGEREQGRQDQREPSPDDEWRLRQRPTLEHWNESTGSKKGMPGLN